MNILSGLFELAELLIIVIGFYPYIIIEIYSEMILLPILVLITLIVVFIKVERKDLIKYMVVFHLFCLGTFIATKLNPGTDDSLGGLSKVVDSMAAGCFCALCACITLIVFIVKIFSKNESKEISTNTSTPVVNRSDIYCIHCGTYNDKTNSFCTKCGVKLSKGDKI